MTTPTTRTQRWVLALTATAALMVALDQLVVATALNSIRDDLHASIETLDWTVNAYSLSFAVLLITGSALGDRYGRLRLFTAGLALFCLASVACALAPNVALLITARAVQGAGSALVMPLAVSLLTAAFPIEQRGRVVGIFTGIVGLAVVGGPVVGGAVTDGISWQWIFWINVPIGAALIPLALARMTDSRGPRVRPDIVGLALVTVALCGIVWGLVRADAAGWASAEVLTTLIGGGLAGAAFVRWELRAPAPMLPMQLFRARSFSAGNAAAFLLTASLVGSVFMLAQYLQISLGYSPLGAGLRFIPWTVLLFVVAPIAGSVSGRIGARPLVVTGPALQAIGLIWLGYNVASGNPYPDFIPALVVAGCGTSMTLPAVQNSVMNSVQPLHLGKASGTFNSMRQLGGVFGVAVSSAVFSAGGSYSSPAAFADGVAPALYVCAGLALAASAAGLVITDRQAPAPAPATAALAPEVLLDAAV